MTYTVNIAQNPGLQLGLTGYAAINNASIQQSPLGSGGSLFGNPGLLVTTPGDMAGEGVITPVSPIQISSNHSFSVYIQGTDTTNITVYAVGNPGGVILGSAPVTLTTSYQRVTINNVNLMGATSLYLIISTTSAQASDFWITNVQIEPDPTAHAYCDGGQTGCMWETVIGGVSFQQYQNMAEATANNINSSNLVVVLTIGAEIFVSATANNHTTSAVVTGITNLGPIGAMTDFGVYSLTDPDPAQTYMSWNTAGLTVPSTGYTRSYAVAVPPQDYFVSNGQQLYVRAAYMAAGWEFDSVPNNGWAELADVQVEISPIINNFSTESPSAYNLPRELLTTVKPNRLNYCPNPGIEVSTLDWTPVAAGVLTQDFTVFVPVTVTIDDVVISTSTASLNVAVTTTGDGAQISLSQLIPGDEYIVSAYVQAGSNIEDILMNCANGSTDVLHGNSGTGYDTGGYGAGYYGGNPPAGAPDLYGTGLYGSGVYGESGTITLLPTGQWFRIYTTFTAPSDTVTLSITAVAAGSSTIWIDNILVESGEVLGDYFDGNFGGDYFWETGASPGLGRSYFYDEYFNKTQAVTNVIQHHAPLGISFKAPVYFIPPTQ